jgi:hypothetical protein
LLSCRPSKRGLDIKASRLQESVNKASNVLAIIKDEARTESHMYTYARKHPVSLNSSHDLKLITSQDSDNLRTHHWLKLITSTGTASVSWSIEPFGF